MNPSSGKVSVTVVKLGGTIVEFRESKSSQSAKSGNEQALEKISSQEMKEAATSRIQTTSQELNTVLGGGIARGSIILLSGEPGIGKSTLSLQLANWTSEEIIYISGEETTQQISGRAQRLWISGNHISLLSENNFENILATLQKHPSPLVVFDSISVMYSDAISGTAGSVGQVRYISEKIVEFGKQSNTTCIIIGHVTKDGSLAGPKTLEHMVDTVLYFEGDKYDDLRILRCYKNRFGSSSEIGIYKMLDSWLEDLENPGAEFISDVSESIWSALSMSIEGSRALVIETEALTTYTKFGYPKRSSRGILQSKLDLVIAVLSKYTSVKLESYDVYANITRGLSIGDPGIDLAIAASICSSKLGKALPKNTLFLGELSLTGKLKKPLHIDKRIKQAEKMWFMRIIIPQMPQKTLTWLLPKNSKMECSMLWHISELISHI